MAVKFTVQSNQIVKQILIGGCQTAKGGKKTVIEPADQIRAHIESGGHEELNLLIEYPELPDQSMFDTSFLSKAEARKVRKIQGQFNEEYYNVHGQLQIVGKYHQKNYEARKKKRKAALQELVMNNFTPRNSAMLTLTFGSDKLVPLSVLEEETEEVGSDEISLDMEIMEFYSSFFGDDSKANEDSTKIYTPSGDYADLKHCNNQFKKFVQRMVYRFELFKYVGVMSLQENGNWHYHLICNINYIPFNELHELWGNGSVYFASFKKTGMEGMWKSLRYMQKNLRSVNGSLKGEKGYLASKGLQRNKVYRSWEPEEALEVEKLEQTVKDVEHNYSYKTEHNYRGMADDGLHDRELTSTCKYYKYFVNNGDQFPKLPNAYTKKKK